MSHCRSSQTETARKTRAVGTAKARGARPSRVAPAAPLVAVLLGCLIACPQWTQASDANPDGEAAPAADTQRRLSTVEEQLQILAKAPLQVGYEEGFFLRGADGNFGLRFNGRVASNVRLLEPDTVQDNTVTLDRGRLSADATFYKIFRLRLENDFTASSGLRDAFLAAKIWPALNVQIGQFKVPFSYEALLSKRFIDFVERAAVVNSTVNPSRDIGLMAFGDLADKVVSYQLAVMNGAGQNRSDNNSDKDVIGRLVLAPFAAGGPAHLRGFTVGGAGTFGHQPRETSGAALTKNSIAGTTATGFTFFEAVPRRGDRWRAGGHAAWLDGPFSLVSEYIHTEEARDGLGAQGADLPDLDTNGAYIGGTWLLTGETKPFNARIKPRTPLVDFRNPGCGAWELALRYEFFRLRHGPDTPDADSARNRYDGVVAGVNWYPNELVRLSVNYLYGHFDEAGEDLSPNPDKHSNNAVLGRVQLEF